MHIAQGIKDISIEAKHVLF